MPERLSVTHTLPDDPHPAGFTTVGRPLPLVEVKIAAEATGEPAPVEEWGEIVAAFVQLRLGAAAGPGDLGQYCRAHFVGFKVPRVWDFVTSSRRRAQERSRSSSSVSGTSTPPASATEPPTPQPEEKTP